MIHYEPYKCVWTTPGWPILRCVVLQNWKGHLQCTYPALWWRRTTGGHGGFTRGENQQTCFMSLPRWLGWVAFSLGYVWLDIILLSWRQGVPPWPPKFWFLRHMIQFPSSEGVPLQLPHCVPWTNKTPCPIVEPSTLCWVYTTWDTNPPGKSTHLHPECKRSGFFSDFAFLILFVTKCVHR